MLTDVRDLYLFKINFGGLGDFWGAFLEECSVRFGWFSIQLWIILGRFLGYLFKVHLGRLIDYLTTFPGNLRGSFWGCSGLFGGVWEGFLEENWGKILGENPSEVVNETI